MQDTLCISVVVKVMLAEYLIIGIMFLKLIIFCWYVSRLPLMYALTGAAGKKGFLSLFCMDDKRSSIIW